MAENFKPKTSGWVLKHFGITRGKLEKYDELIVPETRESQKYNKNQYREYQYEDIEKLWYIHMLSQMGMQMREIKALAQKDEISFREVVIQRIEDLEAEKRRIEGMISIAKRCRATGRIPLPRDFADVPFADYRDKVWREWRCDDTPASRWMSEFSEYKLDHPRDNADVEKLLSIIECEFGKKLHEFSEEDLCEMAEFIPQDFQSVLVMASWELEIARMYPQEVSSAAVQNAALSYCLWQQRWIGEQDCPVGRIADHLASQFFDGDASIELVHKYGKERQEYIARAFEYFAAHC